MDLDTSDLDRQIASLQAERSKKLLRADQARLAREKEDAKVLVGLTPTKPAQKDVKIPDRMTQPLFAPAPHPKMLPQSLPSVIDPCPSRMSTSLAALRCPAQGSSSSRSAPNQSHRSFSFVDRVRPTAKSEVSSQHLPSAELGIEDKKTLPRDADSLTIIEDLRTGPRMFGRDPEGEEEWLHLEPNSSIRLSRRSLPHSSVQDHLSGRYHLSPSLLYSVIRLSRDGATYDVPLEGDWVVIAVVAERGEVKVSGTKEDLASDDDVEEDVKFVDKGKKEGNKKAQGNGKDIWKRHRGPRKYINLKLCALPPRTKGPSGDALLQLLLFESDAVVRGKEDENGEAKTTYRGGSGGAYEKWCNLGVGSVIAVLNPRVLRPLRAGSQPPHPLTLPLALNPASSDTITLIGQARDLGCCSAQQKDGNRCKAWVDLRQSQVCEYHIHAAVHRGRAGRAEFTASTNGFTLQSRGENQSHKRSGFDAVRRSGLLPASGTRSARGLQSNDGGGATYVVSGNTINTHRSDGGLKHFGDEHLSEKLGRGRAEKKRRKMEDQMAEAALERLLDRDGKSGSTGAKYLTALDKRKGKKGGEDVGEERKRPFSAHAIKTIGFDPTSRQALRDGEDRAKRLETIALLKDHPDRPIKLGRPKGLGRSNVRAPPLGIVDSPGQDVAVEEGMVDLE